MYKLSFPAACKEFRTSANEIKYGLAFSSFSSASVAEHTGYLITCMLSSERSSFNGISLYLFFLSCAKSARDVMRATATGGPIRLARNTEQKVRAGLDEDGTKGCRIFQRQDYVHPGKREGTTERKREERTGTGTFFRVFFRIRSSSRFFIALENTLYSTV